MSFQDTSEYIKTERAEILQYKMEQSKTSQRDISDNDAALMWINKNADTFRQSWERKHSA